MFRFKEFTIAQDRTAMKVGTDAVLLGAWVELHGHEQRVLDIGAGSGLIALMMAQRTQHYPIAPSVEGVEVDHASYTQAVENAAASPWAERLVMHLTPIQHFEASEKYDLIVSNPPFFVDSLLAPNAERSNARHTTLLPFDQLIESVVQHLAPGGHFAVVLPTTEQQLFDKLATNRLSLVRRCSVKGGVRSQAKRQLSDYTLANNNPLPQLDELTIRNHEGEYSEEYRELTREFYLKF